MLGTRESAPHGYCSPYIGAVARRCGETRDGANAGGGKTPPERSAPGCDGRSLPMQYSGSKGRNAQTAPAKATTKSGFEPRFASEDHSTRYNHCTGQEPNEVSMHEVGQN